MMNFNRRSLLRGSVAGMRVAVALPLLNCFLDGNGEALANGKPMPLRFGTWGWGLGMNKAIFVPKTIGASYDLPEEIESFKNIKQHMNIFTNFSVFKDDMPNLCHYTGWVALRCGVVPAQKDDLPRESIDVTIANKIGGGTRFRSIEATASGGLRDSYSFRGANAYNTPEISPLGLYQRIFGPEFQDPNARTFTPSASALTRKSVLSGIMDEAKALQAQTGAEDRARLDQYFTGLRDVERQLEHQLIKPEKIDSCRVSSKAPKELDRGLDAEVVGLRHKLMTDLLVMALACDQTRVFNLTYAPSGATTTRTGYPGQHHGLTHTEPTDPVTGYQPLTSWFIRRAMESWAYLVEAMAKVPEGNGTLLSNSLIYAHSDQEYARVHSLNGLPMFTAGNAGGRIKTGIHVSGLAKDTGGRDQPGTRLGYTILKVMGLDIPNWGAKSNLTNKEISEILT
jgi:hypothetical protein